MKNSKMAKYDDINETSKDIPDLEFCREGQKKTSDNIKAGVSKETYFHYLNFVVFQNNLFIFF